MSDIENAVEQIINENKRLAEFWSNSYGWGPDNAAELLNKSRLDWQVSLSEVLSTWIKKVKLTDGELILSWANLGALIEGSMKILFSVYYNDYLVDPIYNKKNEIIDPDIVEYEKLKQHLFKKNILDKKWEEYLTKVQGYRNAIHAFKDKDIGTKEILHECIIKYMELVKELDKRLPYP